MSKTVDEFMQKATKRFSCGFASKRAKKSLIRAFTASSSQDAAQEKELFEKIVDSVMLTKEGRDTMKALSKLGYSFAFEKGDFGGFCSPEDKKIVINPSFGFEYMLQTAVHEGRHAIQFSMENPNAPESVKTNVASYLRKARAIEADAVAHEMAFVYECRKALPAVYREAEKQDLPMFRAYVDEMDKSGDQKKAMQACFAAWYECDSYRDFYDKWNKDDIKTFCDWAKKEKAPDCFTKEYSAEDVLKMCVYKDKPYMTADFLNTGKAFSVTRKDKEDFLSMMKLYSIVVRGATADKSVSQMRERTASGELLPDRKETTKTTALVSSVLNRKER
ncbi:MAG: hypothetical protein J5787_07940 [Alphaproteobacteria bacterium]|nr:hypothetical protein [Alphaproteobacteria bacterium]